MANLFVIMKTEEMSENEWGFLKKLDKSDRVVFLAPAHGMLPYKTLQYFYELKNKPEIYPFLDMDTYSLVFFIGMQAASIVNGKCYLITENTFLNSSQNALISFDKTSVEIKIMDSLEKAIADKKGTATGTKGKRTTSATAPSELEAEADVLEDEPVEETAISDGFTNFEEEVSGNVVVTPEFRALLQRYSTTSVNLLKYENILAECAMEYTEGVLSSFEFQLRIKLGEEKASSIYPLLEEHVQDLKNAL